MTTNVGENITKYRKLNGMSRKYLAESVGISPQGLYKIERGIASPKADTLGKFIEVLCITPNQLFGFEKIDEDNGSILARLRRLKEASGE